MFSTRRLAIAAVSALVAGMVSAPQTLAQESLASCEHAEISVLASPIAPWKGAPLRVLIASEKPLDGELALTAPDGSVAARSAKRHGGPPYFWIAEVASPTPGTWRAVLTPDRAIAPCTRDIPVRADRPPRPSAPANGIWPLRDSWTRANENLFSAWIEKLFDDPLDAAPSWPALHEVLRDEKRNVLFNHLGLNEDAIKMVLRPDCADLPYFLRAYFAFKLGLPFGFSKCTRGSRNRGPVCAGWTSMATLDALRPPEPRASATSPGAPALANVSMPPEPPPRPTSLVGGFGTYMRAIGNGVHSGSARTALNDNNTDYYPVALTQETLRPGAVYADPYGHILMIVRRVAQTPDAAGIILAVDGQPDGTVARKRFWRGNFLFAQDAALGGPGFKRFRPVVRGTDGVLRRLTNEQIAKNPHYADFSLEQAKVNVEEFYDRMDDVMSPSPLDPLRAMMEAITSLEEQVKARVTSVENGRKWQNSKRGEASMPNGPAIFETTGAWEDFATPSRDLRLLIAIDVVLGFPDRVARRPERYAMPAGKSVADVKAQLQNVLASELASRKFSYARSDGSQWTLSLKDVADRRVDLEMAYNLNDCVELRWAAPAQSEEAATCRRHAPQSQRAKMLQYRPWFAERRRPPRG